MKYILISLTDKDEIFIRKLKDSTTEPIAKWIDVTLVKALNKIRKSDLNFQFFDIKDGKLHTRAKKEIEGIINTLTKHINPKKISSITFDKARLLYQQYKKNSSSLL
jgi:hypothetical protein